MLSDLQAIVHKTQEVCVHLLALRLPLFVVSLVLFFLFKRGC